MWKSNAELGREYIHQAEELEGELKKLKRQRPGLLEEKRRHKIRIAGLEGIIADLRGTGELLIHYDDKEENV